MNSRASRWLLPATAACLFVVGCGTPATNSDTTKISESARISYEVSFVHREMSPSGPVLIEGRKVVQKDAGLPSTVDVAAMGMKATVKVKAVE